MKKNIVSLTILLLLFSACENTLDLVPIAQPSAEQWYSSESEIQLALNDLYRPEFWTQDEDLDNNYLSDDGFYRQTLSAIKAGTVTSQWPNALNLWTNSYKAIARANKIIEALNSDQTQAKVLPARIATFLAEARFHRAAQYARLVTHFGDVIYSDGVLSLEEAYTKGRTDKNEVKVKVYEDFDAAINSLPVSYAAAAVKRVTKGAAYALKARFALYMSDYRVAADAAKGCIDLKAYTLHADFASLFLQSTKNSPEVIFALPRSIALKSIIDAGMVRDRLSRNAGGFGAANPTWDLFCSFLCTDGNTIDQSPLYDPRNPFRNRDPRCTATIVEFGTAHLGFIYNPIPTALQVTRLSTNTQVTNNDNRVNAQFASFNGLVWKKGIDNSWLQNGNTIEPDQIVIRYADVLLMYAEAKIELNEIDDTVLTAINTVRARAYKVAITAMASYPSVTIVDQIGLRKIVRMERRMELASEGLRYMDIVRWRIAGKVLSRPIYGMLNPADLRTKVVDKGLWFFPGIPVIEADGTPNFKALEDAGLIQNLVPCAWNDRQYLWPIPTAELQINTNIKQNPDY